jgi:[acyl-carrier-protein] S-malonyltransferase
VLAILCPGQGAQQQGFLTPWLTADDVAVNLTRMSEVAGIDLVAAGTEMSDTDIKDTAIAQPLIVAASLVTAALLPDLPRRTVIAGHSVGEFAAVAIAGIISNATAIELVGARGAAMAAASALQPSGMTAVLGGDPDDVSDVITRSGCVTANVNATGQVVAAGTSEALARLATAPPSRARLRPLAVAGAFHTDLMASARDVVAGAVSRIEAAPPELGLLSNADGAVITDGAEAIRRLGSQVCSPVRWDLCLNTLRALGVTATIELAPAGTLTALVRRELPDVVTLALRSPDDLPAARELIAQHAAEISDEAPPWLLVVAPDKGTVVLPQQRQLNLDEGDVVLRLTTRADEIEVRAPRAGHLVEWLVSDGDPVSAGQPLARLGAEHLA